MEDRISNPFEEVKQGKIFLKRMEKSQENLCDLWGSTKLTNIKIIEFPGEKNEKMGGRG